MIKQLTMYADKVISNSDYGFMTSSYLCAPELLLAILSKK